MLERIREGSQGFWAVVILGLVILSFVFAGVGGYMTSSTSAAAATVNGDEISQSTLERAYQNERARLESQYGEAFAALAADAEYLKQFRLSVLNRLIGDKLLEQTARDMGVRPSDKQVRDTILDMQEFQLGGQFNNDRYQAIIRQAGFQPDSFRDYIRNELTRQQVATAIIGSEFSLSGETRSAFDLQAQTRNLQYLTVPAKPFESTVEINDDEITAYYQENLNRYDTQEQVSVSYVELSVDDLMPTVSATEEELLAFYEQSSDLYQTEEERRVSHILIEFGEDKDAAQAKAAELLVELNGGADFSELAKANSADTFTAENGGDLDFFGRGAMDPAFEEAAFNLAAAGDISEVVESAFGYHLILLTDVKPQQVTPFADVKADIEERVKTDKAIEVFYNVQQRMAEVAFELPDSLEDVAAEANKEVVTSELFTRNTAPALLNTPEVLTAAFSPELIEDAVNSDVIELEDNHILVLRVAEHNPERTKSQDEVADEIRASLLADKAQGAARQWAEGVVTAIDSGEDITDRLSEYALNWESADAVARFGAQVQPELVEEGFKLAATEGQNTAAVDLTSGDVGIVKVLAVNQADTIEEAQLQGLTGQLTNIRSQLLLSDVIESLREQAEINILVN